MLKKILDYTGLQYLWGKINNKLDQRIAKALISHILDSNNPDMVLGADQGPVITGLISALENRVNVLNYHFGAIKSMNAVLQSVTVDARAASAEISVDVSNIIPDGYRIVDIRPRSSGTNYCFVSFMDWSGSNAPKINYVVRNVTDERVTATPSAKLLLMPITTQ